MVIIAAPGTGRTCSALCYDACGPVCCCVCGGANHGIGRADAIANARVPARHPESPTRPLRRAQDRRPAALAARLRPHDEYARELQ